MLIPTIYGYSIISVLIAVLIILYFGTLIIKLIVSVVLDQEITKTQAFLIFISYVIIKNIIVYLFKLF